MFSSNTQRHLQRVDSTLLRVSIGKEGRNGRRGTPQDLLSKQLVDAVVAEEVVDLLRAADAGDDRLRAVLGGAARDLVRATDSAFRGDVVVNR